MINTKEGQWTILPHTKYIRMCTDNVPAGLLRVFLLEELCGIIYREKLY